MAKKTGKRKGKGQGAKKRKARIADLEKDIFTANKRAHFQSKRDDELFVIDNKHRLQIKGGVFMSFLTHVQSVLCKTI